MYFENVNINIQNRELQTNEIYTQYILQSTIFKKNANIIKEDNLKNLDINENNFIMTLVNQASRIMVIAP